jgi:phenylalanyl-tRNA synthetase beta chain
MGVNLQKLNIVELQNDLFSDALIIQNNAGRQVAVLGIVHPKIRKQADIDQEVYFADIQWNNVLKEIKRHKVQFSEIPRYPEVKRDLALLLDKEVTFAQIEKIAFETEKKLLKKVNLFDVYEGKNLEAGKKSYAISFLLQDETKTLTDTQIEPIMKKLQNNFETKLGAKLR